MSSSAEKPRLSADQKKANHIESERKRREAIRSGFEKLADIVPDSQGQARSEGVVLANTVKHIHEMQARKEQFRKDSQKKGMSDLRFEQYYRDAAKKVKERREDEEDAEEEEEEEDEEEEEEEEAAPPPPKASSSRRPGS